MSNASIGILVEPEGFPVNFDAGKMSPVGSEDQWFNLLINGVSWVYNLLINGVYWG